MPRIDSAEAAGEFVDGARWGLAGENAIWSRTQQRFKSAPIFDSILFRNQTSRRAGWCLTTCAERICGQQSKTDRFLENANRRAIIAKSAAPMR
jgi:hypothetical protein